MIIRPRHLSVSRALTSLIITSQVVAGAPCARGLLLVSAKREGRP